MWERSNNPCNLSEDEIREVLSGHLCRCTGYAGIVAAVLAVSGGSPN